MTSLAEGETGAELAQKPVELILLRELASRLTMPVSLYDANRKLVYMNEAAERLMAVRFVDLGEISHAELIRLVRPLDAHGRPIPAEQMPGGIALIGRRAEQTTAWMHDVEGGAHWCAMTSMPLDTQGGAALGAMSIVWEIGHGDEAPPAW
jgi:PAS domain-containing protein